MSQANAFAGFDRQELVVGPISAQQAGQPAKIAGKIFESPVLGRGQLASGGFPLINLRDGSGNKREPTIMAHKPFDLLEEIIGVVFAVTRDQFLACGSKPGAQAQSTNGG